MRALSVFGLVCVGGQNRSALHATVWWSMRDRLTLTTIGQCTSTLVVTFRRLSSCWRTGTVDTWPPPAKPINHSGTDNVSTDHQCHEGEGKGTDMTQPTNITSSTRCPLTNHESIYVDPRGEALDQNDSRASHAEQKLIREHTTDYVPSSYFPPIAVASCGTSKSTPCHRTRSSLGVIKIFLPPKYTEHCTE